MNTKLLPGAAAKLRHLGVPVTNIGRITNKAAVTELPDDMPIPDSPAQLAEMLADDDRVKPVLANRQVLGDFMNRYANKFASKNPDTQQDLDIKIQQGLANFLRDKGANDGKDAIQRLNLHPDHRPAGMLTSHKQATAYNKAAPGAKIDNLFETGADFFNHVWFRNHAPEAQDKIAKIRNAASSVIPADGGFLVPETLRSQLLQLALEMAVVRPRATVVPMETARVPFPLIDATTNASSVFGGMIAYWSEESGALNDASPKFGRVVLDAKKLTGYSVVPNELLADSLISFAALIERLWPQALAWYEDVAFMVGSGSGEPLGFLGSGNTAAVAVAKETGQAADTIVLENVIKMYSRMIPSSLNRAVWIASPECLPQLFTMALNVGTGGAPVMLSNVTGQAPVTIFGRPLIVSEKAGRLGDRTDLSFVDLSYYLVGDRQVMSASSSEHVRFGNDQTAFRLIQRVDGRPWLANAITPQNGGDTLSPFVELAERA